jgi:hypothetical protein
MKKVIFSFLLALAFTSAWTQETSPEKKWKFLIEPYLVFPNMQGEVGVRNLPAIEVDANPSDIFSNLKFGGMLYLEAQTKNWAITTDFLYMDLEQDVNSSTVIASGTASAEQLMFEFAGLYRIAPFLEAGIGGRINEVRSGVDLERNSLDGTEPVEGEISQSWFDPVLITRFTTTAKEKWFFMVRADFGGFGVGSTFTWQAQGNVGYRFSHLFQTSIGYRILGMDYDQGSGEDRFRYNVNTFGPTLRFGFNL